MTPDSAKALTSTKRLKLASKARECAISFAETAWQAAKHGEDLRSAPYRYERDAMLAAIDALAASPDSAPAQEAMQAWREVLSRARDGLGAGGRSHSDQAFIDYGSALIDHIAEQLEATPPAQEAAVTQQPAKRDREADRARFPDPQFNRWLDEAITENGEYSVWHQIGDTCAAWHGWQNREFYPATKQQPAASAVQFRERTHSACKFASGGARCVSHCGDAACLAWEAAAPIAPEPAPPQAAGVEALAEMEARKDAAYLERNQVVAALAKAFPSGITRTAIEGWSEDWHGCVYIDLPTGQASWHFHDSQAYLFDGLPPYAEQWDGHNTPEKYRRLAALAPKQAAASPEIDALEHEAKWSVFNTGAEVAGGLSLAEAYDYMTPERISRGWTMVSVISGQAEFDRLAAAARQAPTGADAVDAERGRWLLEVGFRFANVDLGADDDGAHVVFEPRFYIPEPAGMSYEDNEWTVTDIRAAIDAARKAQPTRGEA